MGLSDHHLELQTEPVSLGQPEGDEVKGHTAYRYVRRNYKHDTGYSLGAQVNSKEKMHFYWGVSTAHDTGECKICAL